MAFIRPVGNSMYGIYDPLGVKLIINRSRLGLSHLREYKFRHNFADTANPFWSCTLGTENTEPFFLRQNNLFARTTLINELKNISNAINSLNSTDFIRVILYGDKAFDNVTNSKIITATIKFIKTMKRFEEALF